MYTRRLELPQTLSEAIFSCETVCAAECCGLEAFDFSAARFDTWFREQGEETKRAALHELEAAIDAVSAQSEEKVFSEELNVRWTREEAVAFLGRLKGLMSA